MKDLVEAIGTRIKSPYFGYAIFASMALNWEAIFILLLSDSAPRERISEFNGETSTWTLLILPLLFGFTVALLSPWIRFCFEYVSRKPFELSDELKLEAQHKNTIKQAELEKSRANLFAIKETELIERAKRDEEVAEISDEDTKAKLSKELVQLRNERDRLSSELRTGGAEAGLLSEAAIELLREAAKANNGAILFHNVIGERSVRTGGKVFGKNDAREFAMYESGLEELKLYGYVKERGNKGEIFELTGKGWNLSEKL